MNILYVEDNPVHLELMRSSLTELSPACNLDVATTLAEGKARLEDPTDLDLVLCDLYLPDGMGFELLAYIRERHLPLAVVMITGSGDQSSAVAALKAGADGYLTKHANDMGQVHQTLNHALAHFRAFSAYGTRALRVLYAESDVTAAETTRRHLAQHAPHIRLDIAADATELMNRLPRHAGEAAAFDAVLLCDQVSGGSALEVVKILRDDRAPELPVVLITSTGSEELAARALFLGVDDILTKHEGYLHELPSALENAYGKVQLVRERVVLQEREAHIRLLLESIAEGIYGVDLEGRCTFVNPACLRILGYERAEELVGQPMHELTHHSLVDGSHYPREECRMYRAYMRDEAIHCDDEVFWRRDGTPVPVEYWSYPMRRDGHVVGAVATFLDITKRRHTEERLRQAAMVFDNTRDGVLITDLDGRILAVNPAFSSITGYPEAEILGRMPGFLNSGRYEPAFFETMWADVRTEGYWQGEIWNRRKNGEVYPNWLTISTVRNEAGEPTHYVSVSTDLSHLRESQARLDHLSHHDPLTNLPNRLLLQLRLDHALDRSLRRKGRLGLLYIDLDRFKAVNDSLGHSVGDQLLLAVVGRLRGRVRQEDTLAHLGGDEFLLLLEHIDDAQVAADVARDLLAALAPPFRTPDGHEVFIGASIGISIYPDNGGNMVGLLRDAEAAMYRSKEQARGSFCFYTSDLNADALANLELESALRRALDRNELELHYQPKVDLQSGRVTGAEALLRWYRDGGEPVSPARFIPLAEKTGLIVPIGAWVIDTACRQIRAWNDAGLSELQVAVNVSAHQFRASNLEAVVADALQRHGLPARQLELELTESTLMDDPASAAILLDRLKQIGVKIALDDFGTGYSSFAYLRRFPIDAVKIDQSFVRDVVTEPGAAGIVTAIIGLAQRMHLRVVAEGVETDAQLGYLRKHGCDVIQGHYFGMPAPAEDYAELVRKDRSRPRAEPTDPESRTLLLVDDEPNILSALRRLLRSEGYRILIAHSAREGLDLLARNTAQVILSDQRMPEMSGTEFLGRVRELHPDTVRIVLSGFTELETIIQAVNHGAIYKFLTKPWDDELLRGHVREAFRYHDAVFQSHGDSANAA